ncbi:MAG: heterodisulfide reductase-related iron-sulfur binding cluster [Acidimicrobiales bacterium]
MTTTYDPAHPAYRADGDLREEMSRVFDLCHGCRLCFNLCPAFPTLFEHVDSHDGSAAEMSRSEQDQVVDECYQCKLCAVKCPYLPPHEWQLDFPRMILRATVVRRENSRDLRAKVTDQVLGRTDLLGSLATMAAPAVNAVIGARGGPVRKLMESVSGIASDRLLPPYAKQRFSTWWKARSAGAPGGSGAPLNVALFTTCFVEYMEPSVGKALVGVYERNGIACSLPDGLRCCGAPWLHAGLLPQFTRHARANVQVLSAEVRAGRDVVVAEPTCAYVLKRDYPIYAPSPDAELVAAATYDSSEYLDKLRRSGDLDTGFTGEVPASVAYHAACHLQAQSAGLKARDLIKATGAKVRVVAKCSGIDGTWGYRAANYDLSTKVAEHLHRELSSAIAAGAEVVVGDCHLANSGISERTGSLPLHPMQLLAKAYGLPGEPR